MSMYSVASLLSPLGPIRQLMVHVRSILLPLRARCFEQQTRWWYVYGQDRFVALAPRKLANEAHVFANRTTSLCVHGVAIEPYYHKSAVCTSVLGWCALASDAFQYRRKESFA